MPNVSNIVKTIQDIMRKDAGTYGDAQRLEQLGWMFFLKIFDDREKEVQLLQDDYRSPLPKHLRWSTWAADDEGDTGEKLLDFVNNTLLPKLKTLNGGAGRISGLIRMAFEDANNYMKNGTLMRQVINKINGIDFNASDDRHMFGDIYEKLLKDLQSAGNAGEFYTPRAVTQFIVEQVDPRLGESVLDPACGTGGFLVNAIEHLRKQTRTPDDERTIQDSFAGIEKKHLPHVLCMTNLLLHGIDVPSNVRHDNTLARPLRDWGPKERVDVIVTNPPFGGMEEDGIESNYPAEFRTRETADLFLVLLMKILKPGGRAGLVLPDGTLFGEGVKTRIKEALLNECNLHTIVRLPNGVFNPYTGIRTNLLFFTKGQPTTHVWYYEHPYPPGAKSYNKGKPIRIEEFDGERTWWGSEKDAFTSRVENQQAWRVSIDQIKAGNFNLDLKNPHNPDTGPGDVDHLLPEYEKTPRSDCGDAQAIEGAANGGVITVNEMQRNGFDAGVGRVLGEIRRGRQRTVSRLNLGCGGNRVPLASLRDAGIGGIPFPVVSLVPRSTTGYRLASIQDDKTRARPVSHTARIGHAKLTLLPDAGGISAFSRWLSTAIPPVTGFPFIRTPAGVPASHAA